MEATKIYRKQWRNLGMLLCICICSLHQNVFAQQRNITIDAQEVTGYLDTSFKKCVGAGRANEGLRADWQQQLAFVKKECGFEFIRMHGLLHDDMGIVYQEDKNGKPFYNWQYIDLLYDYLLKIGMKPFVELSFMPSALASGNQTVFWWKGNITPPKDEQKWSDFIKALVQHLSDRYGTKEVATWYFEVWNEPNLKDLFFTGNQQDYFRLYAATARAVKAVNDVYKVGGPATAGSRWIPEFLQFCIDDKVPVDFIATHTYGVKEGFLDNGTSKGQIVGQNYDAIYKDIIQIKSIISKSAKPSLELHYTEWSSSYSPRDPIHDSYYEAAYILDKIKHAQFQQQSMSYWTFSDIFEEGGGGPKPFHGGFGLINQQDILKPAFYSYKYLNLLGSQSLKCNDTASFVTKDAKGNMQILFWDFTITHPGDSVTDQEYYTRILPAKDKGVAQIQCNHISPGKYLVKIFKTGFENNDAYTAYLRMGAPSYLSPKEVDKLKGLSAGLPVKTETITINKDGSWKTTISQKENDVIFIQLIKQS